MSYRNAGFWLIAGVCVLLRGTQLSSAEPSTEADGRRKAGGGPVETKYLTFQVFTYSPSTDPMLPPHHLRNSKAEIANTVNEIIAAIGARGDRSHKLGFNTGPLTFDQNDAEILRLIRQSFEIAVEQDVAVAFHIDDSTFWAGRKDLINDPDNLEWLNWNKAPNTGRRLDWSPTPTRHPPQMCFNSPAVKKAVQERAGLIGGEIKRQLDLLKLAGREELFAGVIAGWETMLGRDFVTGRYLGYAALSHKGFTATQPPADLDQALVTVVKEFVELWAKALADAGIPKEKLYSHIAFTPQGLRKGDEKLPYARSVHYATPDVAFSPFYRPGFSTYPDGKTFEQIHAELAKHDNPSWISSEGTNVIPNGMPGEPSMESYLGKMFNHGAVMVNIFSWGIGGEAEKKTNFFRLATENKEARAAYKKFLTGASLNEDNSTTGFSAANFQRKILEIQTDIPAWVEKTHSQAIVEPLMRKLDSLIKQTQFKEANNVADEILELLNGK